MFDGLIRKNTFKTLNKKVHEVVQPCITFTFRTQRKGHSQIMNKNLQNKNKKLVIQKDHKYK